MSTKHCPLRVGFPACSHDCALAVNTASGTICAIAHVPAALSRIATAHEVSRGTNYAVHPSSYLDEWMESEDASVEEVAAVIDYPVSEVRAFCDHERIVDDEAARALAGLTGIPSIAWVRYCIQYISDCLRLNIPYSDKYLSRNPEKETDE